MCVVLFIWEYSKNYQCKLIFHCTLVIYKGAENVCDTMTGIYHWSFTSFHLFVIQSYPDIYWGTPAEKNEPNLIHFVQQFCQRTGKVIMYQYLQYVNL